MVILLCLLCLTAHAQKLVLAPAVKNGYLCTIDTAGRVVADSLYPMDELNKLQMEHVPELFHSEGIYRLRENGLFGFKDHKGHVIAPFIFVETGKFVNGLVAVRHGQKWGCINRQGRYIADTLYDHVSDAVDGRIVLRRGQDIAVIDTMGRFILPFYYKTDATYFPEPTYVCGLLRVMVKDTIVPGAPVYEWSITGHDPYDPGWKIGFVDKSGKLVIDTVYHLQGALRSNEADYIDACDRHWVCGTGMSQHQTYQGYHLNGSYYQFDRERCLVMENGRPVVIDTGGHARFTIYTDQFDDVLVTNIGGFFTVQKRPVLSGAVSFHAPTLILKNGKVVGTLKEEDPNLVYNANGKVVLHFKEDEDVYRMSETRLVKVSPDKQTAKEEVFVKPISVYDTSGRFFFRFYNSWQPLGGAQYATEGRQTLNGVDGFITTKGKFRSREGEFWTLGENNEGTMMACQKERYGFVTPEFQWAIEPTYEMARSFSHGFAAVKKGGKWGFIDHKGRVRVPYVYDAVSSFIAVSQ